MKPEKHALTEYPWILSESHWAAHRKLSKTETELKGQSVLNARLTGVNHRLAEALLLNGDDEPFQKVKTLLSRGHLAQAEEKIQSIDTVSELAAIELQLEKARLAAFEGDWERCTSLCSHEIEKEIPGITRLTFLQVRALACLELGLFSQASRDIESMESMQSIYPNSPVFHYFLPMKIRLNARMGRFELANHQLTEAWHEAREGNLNLDLLLTLLRAETDLCFQTQRDASSYARASLSAADALGDRLYCALARVDIHHSGLSSPQLSEALVKDASEYKRVRKLLQSRQVRISRPLTDEKPEFLLISNHQLLVRLKPFAVFPLKKGERLSRVINVLSLSSCEKEELFKKAWHIAKYVPHLHENIIDQAISRIRRKYGLRFTREAGVIRGSGILRV